MTRIEEARGSVPPASRPTQDTPKLQVDAITEALHAVQSYAASKANQPTAGEGLTPEDDSATCQRPPNCPADGTVDDILISPDERHSGVTQPTSEDGDDANNMGGLIKPPPRHQINDSTETVEFEHRMADNEDRRELMNEVDGPDDADDADDMIYAPWRGFSEMDDCRELNDLPRRHQINNCVELVESFDQTPENEEYDGPKLMNEDNGPDDGCNADDTDDMAYAPWRGFSEVDDCRELTDLPRRRQINYSVAQESSGQTSDDEECHGQMDEGDGLDGGDNANTSPKTCAPQWHEFSTFRDEGHTGMMNEGNGNVQMNIEGNDGSEEDGSLCAGLRTNLGKSIEREAVKDPVRCTYYVPS
jgi:hypothetical protein